MSTDGSVYGHIPINNSQYYFHFLIVTELLFLKLAGQLHRCVMKFLNFTCLCLQSFLQFAYYTLLTLARLFGSSPHDCTNEFTS
jgi:hypothetical protein